MHKLKQEWTEWAQSRLYIYTHLFSWLMVSHRLRRCQWHWTICELLSMAVSSSSCLSSHIAIRASVMSRIQFYTKKQQQKKQRIRFAKCLKCRKINCECILSFIWHLLSSCSWQCMRVPSPHMHTLFTPNSTVHVNILVRIRTKHSHFTGALKEKFHILEYRSDQIVTKLLTTTYL